ncbi:uncharacterized protein METZ01_LOCUS10223 [marine metagenome]|uniref:Uncharacterized protein n=1 Tax=marine metagenome TaxID=408172 RepID=A0A381NSU5_9ZZZZ
MDSLQIRPVEAEEVVLGKFSEHSITQAIAQQPRHLLNHPSR